MNKVMFVCPTCDNKFAVDVSSIESFKFRCPECGNRIIYDQNEKFTIEKKLGGVKCRIEFDKEKSDMTANDVINALFVLSDISREIAFTSGEV